MPLTSHALANHLWPRTVGHPVLRDLALVMLGVLGLTLCAQVRAPFWPVPLTLQTFGLLLIGAIYGARLSVWTVGTYLFLGGLGVPVFAGADQGAKAFFGPAGGYLIGFSFAAPLLGRLVERGWDRTPRRLMTALAAAAGVPLITSAIWLSFQVEADSHQHWGLWKAVRVGVLPYLPGALLELVMATAVLLAGQQVARHFGMPASTAEDERLLQ